MGQGDRQGEDRETERELEKREGKAGGVPIPQAQPAGMSLPQEFPDPKNEKAKKCP